MYCFQNNLVNMCLPNLLLLNKFGDRGRGEITILCKSMITSILILKITLENSDKKKKNRNKLKDLIY